MIKVAKFGGSSVADAEHFKKIKAIVDADPARRFVVVSACGRRSKEDAKVTDLLYLVNAHVKYSVSCDDLLANIVQRYVDIADELGLTYPIREEMDAFCERARSGGYSTRSSCPAASTSPRALWPNTWACRSSTPPMSWPSTTTARCP